MDKEKDKGKNEELNINQIIKKSILESLADFIEKTVAMK